MKRGTRRAIVWSVIAIAVIAVTVLLAGRKKAMQKVEYETARVERTDIAYYVTATGTIEPVTEVQVGTQVSGIIASLITLAVAGVIPRLITVIITGFIAVPIISARALAAAAPTLAAAAGALTAASIIPAAIPASAAAPIPAVRQSAAISETSHIHSH